MLIVQIPILSQAEGVLGHDGAVSDPPKARGRTHQPSQPMLDAVLITGLLDEGAFELIRS
jgi:hypothetical protein